MEQLNTSEYVYSRKVYFTNAFDFARADIRAKMVLSETTFNFDLADFNGKDFRIALAANGSGVLPMWVAHWDAVRGNAVIYSVVPFAKANETITLYAFWGNENAINISDGEKMDFLFFESFSSSTLDSSKWSGDITESVSSYGFPLFTGSDFVTKTNPLDGKNSWTVEAGLYLSSNGSNDNSWSMAFGFEGGENPFTVGLIHLSNIEHNLTQPGGGTWQSISGDYKGLELQSYQNVIISYDECRDCVYQRLADRNTYPDSSNTIYRKVEGDTRIQNIKIRKKESYGGNAYIGWMVVREYEGVNNDSLDVSELYVPFEDSEHQSIDLRPYGYDVTSILYWHESSFGGQPYNLSVLSCDDLSNVWVSDEGAATENEIYVNVSFNYSENMCSRSCLHFDSAHYPFYNASKLSNKDGDIHGKNYWWCIATSGWAAIDFSSIGKFVSQGFMVRALSSDLNGMGRRFTFYGSDYLPRLGKDKWCPLVSGEFTKTAAWQSVSFKNTVSYRYYILDVANTHGGEIKILEWRIFNSLSERPKACFSQLRLHPIKFGDLDRCFPKYIKFQGSNDMVVWKDLVPLTKTYTPFVQHYVDYGYWQRYSFNNSKTYGNYRLVCKGNWGDSLGRIGIGSWSIHSLSSDEHSYTVLGGSSNWMKQVWADSNCGFDDGYHLFYVTNDKLNTVVKDYLVGSFDLPENYKDVVS